MAFILTRGGLTANIREVYLFDALYGQTEKFAHWIERSPGRLVDIYTAEGGTRGPSLDFMDDLRAWKIPFAAVPESAVTDGPPSEEPAGLHRVPARARRRRREERAVAGLPFGQRPSPPVTFRLPWETTRRAISAAAAHSYVIVTCDLPSSISISPMSRSAASTASGSIFATSKSMPFFFRCSVTASGARDRRSSKAACARRETGARSTCPRTPLHDGRKGAARRHGVPPTSSSTSALPRTSFRSAASSSALGRKLRSRPASGWRFPSFRLEPLDQLYRRTGRRRRPLRERRRTLHARPRRRRERTRRPLSGDSGRSTARRAEKWRRADLKKLINEPSNS